MLFDFESSPFLSDRIVQGARMALALALDAQVTLLYRSVAAVLAGECVRYRTGSRDAHDHDRFLIEMEVPVVVLAEDWEALGEIAGPLRLGIAIVSAEQARQMYLESDVVFSM